LVQNLENDKRRKREKGLNNEMTNTVYLMIIFQIKLVLPL